MNASLNFVVMVFMLDVQHMLKSTAEIATVPTSLTVRDVATDSGVAPSTVCFYVRCGVITAFGRATSDASMNPQAAGSRWSSGRSPSG